MSINLVATHGASNAHVPARPHRHGAVGSDPDAILCEIGEPRNVS